jgi:hypothetical protein
MADLLMDVFLDVFWSAVLVLFVSLWSFVIAASLRAGWDWAGLHTKKAPHVSKTFIHHMKGEANE